MRSWAELANVKVKKGKAAETAGFKAADNQKVEEIFQAKLKEKGFTDEKIAQIHMNQRASMDDAIPKSLNYEQWLKSKPVELQQQVLGQQRWQLWHDGKASIDQMTDGNGQPLSVAELHQAVKDNVAVPVKQRPRAKQG